MFALDLFNTKYEKELTEGAVDSLEARRIDDLNMRMLELLDRAKESGYKNNPKALAGLKREFQKIKAERDSYFKINPATGMNDSGTLGTTKGALDEQGLSDSNPITSAVTRRILLQRPDLLKKYGPELVGAAIDNVADYVGDVDEIGSSDVSAWVAQVERMLKENPPEAFAEDSVLDQARQRVQAQGFTDSPEERNADRLERKRRHLAALDRISNIGGLGSEEEAKHQAQQRMARDAYDTQRRKDDDEDTRKTFDMFRDRLNRMQYKNQRDVDPKQLAKISAIKYEPIREGAAPGVDAKGRTQAQWIQLVKAKFPDGKMIQAKMPDGPVQVTLPDGRKLGWSKVEQAVAEGWKDEADDFTEWSNYVRERLTKTSPEQRPGLASQLSQLEVKHFGSSTHAGFNRQTGKPIAGVGLTDTVRRILKSFGKEADDVRRAQAAIDGTDGPAGNFSMPFGSVDVQGMENATPEELAVMKKAVMMGPDVAGAAARFYRKHGTITHQDLPRIQQQLADAAAKEWKQQHSVTEADKLPRPNRPNAVNSPTRPRPAPQKRLEVGDIVGFTPQNHDATSSGKVFKAEVLEIGGRIGRSGVLLKLLNPKDIAANGGKPTMAVNFMIAKIQNPYVEKKQPGVAEAREDREFFNNFEQWKAARGKLHTDEDRPAVSTLGGKIIAKWDAKGKYGWIDRSGQQLAEGADSMTPNWAKYVLDQIYNSDGEVTLTDLFDEGIPGLYAMFMDTAQQHGLDPEEDFEDVQHELTLELEDLIKGGHDIDEERNPYGDYKQSPKAFGAGNFQRIVRANMGNLPTITLEFPNPKNNILLDKTAIDLISDYYDGLENDQMKNHFIYRVLPSADEVLTVLKRLGWNRAVQPDLPGIPAQGELPLQEKKKFDSNSDVTAGDTKVARELQKLRAQYPAAKSDVEAVAKSEIDSTERSQQQLAAIKGANTEQDRLLQQLIALDKKQGTEIGSLDNENDRLEQQLAHVEKTNARLAQTIDQMGGQAQSDGTDNASGSRTINLIPNAPADAAPTPAQPQAQPAVAATTEPKQQFKSKSNAMAQMAQNLSSQPRRVQGVTSGPAPNIRGQAANDNDQQIAVGQNESVEENQRLHAGDPIVVTAPNEFEGKTGEIYDFSPSGSFVIVDLYNHGKHSMHLSDVAYNDYANQEEDDWYDEGMDEAKADPTGSWVVYNGGKIVKFKTHTGAKAYAAKNGGKVASSEFYADRIQKQGVAEATPRHFGPKGAGTELARQIRANGDTNWINDLSKDQLNALAGPRYPKRPKIQVKKNKGVAETALNPKDPQGDYAAKRKALQDLGMNKAVDQAAVLQRRLDLDQEAKAKGVTKGSLNEFAPAAGGGGSGDYFQALASAWYNGAFDTGSLQKGIKSKEDVERLLNRGVVGPDGVTRKYGIDYNAEFDGVVISSDDYYEHSDYNDKGQEVDSRTGQLWGPYDYMEFSDDELNESLKEIAPPGAKAERMVKHIKKSLSKDGRLSDKDKAIAYATTWKAHNAGKVEESPTDYQKRRQRERDVDAGRPVKPLPKNPQTDYARKRAKDRKDMEMGEGLGDYDRREFKRQELQHELGHERNNIAIAINGKTWKVVPGKGYADSAEERAYLNGMQRWAEKKSASSGKKWTVSLTGANPTINELSTEKLAQYKTAAALDAGAADKAGNYERGDKRFSGIVKATKKQFANDVKKHKDQGVAEDWKDVVAGGAMALGALGAGAQTMPDINVQQVELANKYYNVLVQRAKEDGIKLDTRTLNVIKAKAQDAASKKTQRSTPQQGFPSQGSERRVAKDASQFESKGVAEGLMKEPTTRKEYLDQRDKLFRMMSVDSNPANKQIIKQALQDLEARYGNLKNAVKEESSTASEAVERAILNRIMVAHTDLLMKFGPDKVMQAAEEVAYNVGDVDEIGTSDVSAYVNQVRQILGA